MNEEKIMTGQCMCGQIKYEVSGPTVGIVNCHCKDCQRLHGNYNPLIVADKVNLNITQGEDLLKEFKSSDDAHRLFCSNCGSQLFKRQINGPKVMISVGNIENPIEYPVIKNIFTESAGFYYTIPEVK
jgi:hypothetical protein